MGAPPGYVGYDEGGQLTEAVRRRPYSVVLLDEIEKAHSDVFNVLLQVMDDGRLTDGQGRTVDFKNTVLIMTSNVAGGMDGVRATFKPEFVNRLDEIVEFAQLTREELGQIVEVQVDTLAARVRERGVEIELTDEARTLLGNLGYDPTYGARPLKRVIQKQLVDKLALKLLEGEFAPGDRVRVDAGDGELRLREGRRGRGGGRLAGGQAPAQAGAGEAAPAEPGATSDYRDDEGNVLTLRDELSAGTLRQLAELDAQPAASAEDRWQRRVEFLFERLAVRWEIAGLPLEGQKELLGRYRMASAEERRACARRSRSTCASAIPERRALAERGSRPRPSDPSEERDEARAGAAGRS